MTHSLEVIEPGVPGPGDGATEALQASVGAGAKDMAGVPAIPGVMDTPGVVMFDKLMFRGCGVLSGRSLKSGVVDARAVFSVGRAEVRSCEPISERGQRR